MVGRIKRAQQSETRFGGAAPDRREDVDDVATADGAGGGLITNNKTIAVVRAKRFVEDQLNESGSARCYRFSFENRDAAGRLGCAVVNMHRRPVRERGWFAG